MGALKMEYIKLGETGLDISRLTLGMMSYGYPKIQKWYKDLDEAKPLIKKAINLGINFFDAANVYSSGRSEEITGEVLNDYRDDIIIATKAINDSLRRLKMDPC